MSKTAQPADEKEQLRQLIRETHEATKDARAAKRELEEAVSTVRDLLYNDLDRHIGEVIQPWVDRVNTRITDAEKLISHNCEETVEKARQIVANAVGWSSWDDMRRAILKSLIRELAVGSGTDLDESVHIVLQNMTPQRSLRSRNLEPVLFRFTVRGLMCLTW